MARHFQAMHSARWRVLCACWAGGMLLSGCAGPRPQVPPPPGEPPVQEQPPTEQPPPAPGDAEVQLAFEQATASLGAGRYSEAIPRLYDVLEHRPSHTVARYNLGVALQRVRQWQEALKVLTAAGTDEVRKRGLAANVEVPEDADADYVHALGTVFQELRRFDEAIACFDAAIAQDAKHLKSRYARALCLQLRGDLKQARTAWRDYLARDPDSSWTESARKHLAEVESRLSTQPR